MKKWFAAAVLAFSVVCFTGIAFALVTPIKPQAVYPIRISQPGSYQLQGNLNVPNSNTTAIRVQADNVTIDLNGFAILGPTVCTDLDGTLVCSPTGTGVGIDAGTHSNIKVYNGTVRGMGDTGIYIGDGAIIESVRVISNGGEGIDVSGSATVSGSKVKGNGSHGIDVISGTVSGNTITGNGGTGIFFFFGSATVSGNTVSDNYGDGIFVWYGTVSGNTVSGNDGIGLSLGPAAGYVNNVLAVNTGGNVSGGVNLKPNLCETVLCP